MYADWCEPVVPPVLNESQRPEIVAMIHVHSITALLNHEYAQLLKVVPYGADKEDMEVVGRIIREVKKWGEGLNDTLPQVAQVCTDGDIAKGLRSLPLLLAHESIRQDLEDFKRLRFVDALVQRARKEAETYINNGITHLEVENVGAPYFIAQGQCPLEELLLEFVVLEAIRKDHPDAVLGMHILSSNEFEALPIALCHGVSFIRSESTVFAGIRPEGQTTNCGNMARFQYVRNILRSIMSHSNYKPLPHPIYPQVWSDLQKKHTVFPTELHDLQVWLDQITFMKLEGLIITGLETGSNVKEANLKQAREAVDKVKAWNAKTFADRGEDERNPGQKLPLPRLPIITGSGLDFQMYAQYADYCIVGTALKEGGYWENPVSEANVKKVVADLDAIRKQRDNLANQGAAGCD